MLVGTVLLVMIVELLNTGIETAIDRIGPEWHSLSKPSDGHIVVVFGF
jgi:diacylglycerol kinase (ATP)